MTAVREMGEPIVQARAEIDKCAWCCEFFCEKGPAMLADVDAPSSASRSYVAFRPLGVLFAIMPWNFPIWQVFAAPTALLAGNADGAEARGQHHALRSRSSACLTRPGRTTCLFTALMIWNEQPMNASPTRVSRR